MALRAFKATFLCCINEDDAKTNEDRPKDAKPVSLAEVKEYLNRALLVDLSQEEHGNPIGMLSVEVKIDLLEEMSSEEVKETYKG